MKKTATRPPEGDTEPSKAPAMCFSPRDLRCFISCINIAILPFKPEHSNVYTIQFGTRTTLATKWYYRQIAMVMVTVVFNFLKSTELRQLPPIHFGYDICNMN